MLDIYIPFDIQVEIIKRLSVKSVFQFRSVSKAWKSLIDSSDFIAHCSALQTQPRHLLIVHSGIYPETYSSMLNVNNTFRQYSSYRDTAYMMLLNCHNNKDYQIVGCSHGLMCLYSDHQEGRGSHEGRSGMAVIWNRYIGKAVSVIVPNLELNEYDTVLGFGVCPETNDPKIVKIRYLSRWRYEESISCIPQQVEVFTLSTGAWRSSYSNIPRKSIDFGWQQADVDGSLYWLSYDNARCLIISFDLKTEEFGEVNLPNGFAEVENPNHYRQISKLRNSLLVLDHDRDATNPVYVVWMMEDGVPKSFTKLYTLNLNIRHAYLKGFRKSGEPIIDTPGDDDDDAQLVVYDL